MADIRSVVKQMIADGESEDVIDAVVKKMQSGSEIKSGLPDMSPAPPPKDEYTGPDTFWGGVKNSLFGKEFDDTARKSLKGFAEGAADIPNTLVDTAHGLAAGVHSLIQDPKAHMRAISPAFREMGGQMWDTVKNAGADPEAFGHMTGQLTGQPLFTEGLIRAPSLTKSAVSAVNRIPRVNQTLSSIGRTLEGTRSPNIVPTSSKGLVAGAVRGAARPIGRALQRVGERGRLEGGTTPPSSRTNIKLKGETETPHSPDSDIFAGGGEGAVRPRPIRQEPRGVEVDPNTEFTRPILETAEELAARNRPSAFTGGPSSRFRDMPYRPGEYAEARPSKPVPAEPVPPKFEPSIDPASFSPEDIALLQAKRANLKAALEKMAGGDVVDPTTGEIINTPRTKGPWRQSQPDEEMGFFGPEDPPSIANDEGRQFASEIEGSRYPGDEAYDLGEINPGFRQTSDMPDWGPPPERTIQPEDWGDWGNDGAVLPPALINDATGSTVAAPAKVRPGINPLRPEVPPGQVTNRSMFELSEQRAAEGRVSPGQEFADSIAPNEFSEDMMFTPGEFDTPVVPEFTSPFENQYDPRISGLRPEGDILEGASPEFSGRRQGPDIANDTGRGKLVKSKKEKNFPSVVPEGFGKVGGKQVGPKGASYSVKGPDGKHLGDINITPAEIAEMKAHEGGMLSHMSDEDLAAAMYEERLGEVLEKHGYSPDEPKIDIQPKTTRTKDVPLTPRDKPMPATTTSIIPEGSEGMESLTDYSGTGREPRFPGDTPKGTNKSAFASKREPIDPDKDFGPGGDIKGIVVEAFRLDRDNAVDTKFRSLLPKEMRTELGPGETYKGKLQRLIGEIQEHEKMSPEQQAQRIAEMDAFNDATRGYSNPMGPEIPPLDPAAIDVSKLRKGKLNQQASPWYSPRMQQQEPDLFRKLMGQPRKKRK